METKRSIARGTARFSLLLGASLVVALALPAPSYAAKPEVPPGQAATSAGESSGGGQGQTSGQAAPATKSAPAAKAQGTAKGQASSHSTQGTAGTSGDVNSPQPPSNADQNGGGANHPGAYDSTRDGSPSGNGNGDGKATGKPCAGCVGKADNKNPKGQNPNASDRNNGYECDGNKGIARTNPAHTGCRPTPPPPPPPGECVDNPATAEDECGTVSPPGECVDNPATAEDECGTVSPPGECVDNPATAEDECGSVSPPEGGPGPGETSTPRKVLPQTGAGVAELWTALAGLLLLAGGALVTGRVRVRA